MGLNKYIITIRDCSMYRHPQTEYESHTVEAVTAADAITIAQVRHKFPWAWKPEDPGPRNHDSKWRELHNIEAFCE